MIRLISLLILVAGVAQAGEWYKVDVTDGEAKSLTKYISGKAHTPDPAKNEYPINYSFPTNEMMYWKKVGTDWVEMNQAEKNAVDAAIRAQAEAEAVADAQLDAILRAIADNIQGKTYDDIKASFKANIDPKKHKNNKKK